MNILIKNIDIVTADIPRFFTAGGNIGIRDGFIEFADSSGENLKCFKADKTIDGRNKLVMPGLVNAHTHCAMTLLRNFADDLALEEWLFDRIFPAESRLTPEDVYWGTLLGIAEMIRSGTTAFADMYIHMDSVARAVTETGIRANLSRNPVKFNNDVKNAAMCNDFEGCFDYYKRWNGSANGRIKVFVEIHSTYLFDEKSLRGAAELAGQCGTGIHIHMLETLGELEDSVKKYGMNSVKICEKCGVFDVPVLAAHCVHVTDEDMAVLRNNGVNVAHNPTSNMKLGSGIARVPRMLDEGINVSLGTDGPASNNNLNMFEEMHLAALIHKGINRDPSLISAEQVVRMATVNGAKTIGFEGETGCIRKGMKADLIILNTDKPHFYPLNNQVSALAYSAQGFDVETVIVDGKVLMENRELVTIDEELVKSKVKEIAGRVLA